MWITRVSINNPVFATMVMVAITVLGLFSYARLRVEQMPDVTLPFLIIQTQYPGASPEAVEIDITRPIENAVNGVAGVKLVRSFTAEGVSSVFAEFRLDTDMMRAMQDVRDKVALVRPGFPKDAKDPLVVRADTENQEPVVSLAVMSTTTGLRELTSLTDQTIVKGLENVPGVARIDVNGKVTRQILVQIKPNALTALGIGLDQVMNAIRNANQDVPAGRLSRGASDTIVRIEGKIKDPAQFGRIIVAQQGGGPVYLSQVADVIDGEKEETSLARINGRASITLDVQKAQDANIVETGRGIVAAVAELKKRIPKDVELTVVYNAGEQVEKSVNRVKSTILEGAGLTVLIVFLFLHSWRSTIITGLTLPLSVIATFIALYAFGFSLNFLTLMALSLCIGLLIDDAIVVRENIVRHLGMGKDHKTAAREGTDEIGLAVMATTFAIVAVFVPIAFMSGIIGRFFFQFGVTVAVAVMVSLFVSFTLDPMLSAVWHDPPGSRFKRVPWLGRFMEHVEHFIEWMHRVYGSILEWALTHRKSVLAISLAAFGGSFALVPLDRHRVRPAGGPGLHFVAAQHAGGLEPRIHEQQGPPGRGDAQEVPGDHAGDDHRRHRRGTQLRAHQPEAQGPRPARVDAKGPREGDSQDAAADSGDRAHRGLQSADFRQHPGTGSGDAHRAGQRTEGARSERAGDCRPRVVREASPTPRCRCVSTTTPPRISASPCSRSGPRCGRCWPAIRSVTGLVRTRRTTRSTCALPRTAANWHRTCPTSI